jgi:hypothetical protein
MTRGPAETVGRAPFVPDRGIHLPRRNRFHDEEFSFR